MGRDQANSRPALRIHLAALATAGPPKKGHGRQAVIRFLGFRLARSPAATAHLVTLLSIALNRSLRGPAWFLDSRDEGLGRLYMQGDVSNRRVFSVRRYRKVTWREQRAQRN